MSRLINTCLSLLFLCFASFCLASGPQNYEGQPWLVESTSFSMISFSLDPQAVQPFLPKGFTPHVNDKNKTSLIAEIYSTEKIAGIPAYKIIFIVAEIAGHPSRTGTPGHFAIWGRIDSKSATDFFTHLGFPYGHAKTLEINTGNSRQIKVASTSGDLLDIQLEASTDAPFSGQGVVDMLVLKDKELLKSEVSFLTQGVFAKVTSFKVVAKNDPVLNLLNNLTPEWALVSNKQIFSYSHLVAAHKNSDVKQNSDIEQKIAQ